MSFGIKITDSSSNELLITPNILTIFESGRASTPTSGSSGSTYGNSIALGNTYAEENVGVLANSFVINIDLLLYNLSYDGWQFHSWFVNDNFSYYTRNESTGILTTFTPNTTSATYYDGLLSVFPVAFWDKKSASSFTSIDIFSATSHLVYDQSSSSFVDVYSVGSQGVENIDYTIYTSNYKG